MKICEIFASYQGEINIGRYALFIRTATCNLQCSFCDSKYAWMDYIEKPVKELVDQALLFDRIIITGGEPFLQREEIAALIDNLKRKKEKIKIEIETNGTIKPLIIGKYTDIQYNVSLKLKNSGNDLHDRIKPQVIKWFNDLGAYFKFVVNKEEDIEEINMFVNDYDIKKQQIFLMPEGNTPEKQIKKLDMVINLAKLNGYNFTPRMHVLLWGDKRGV